MNIRVEIELDVKMPEDRANTYQGLHSHLKRMSFNDNSKTVIYKRAKQVIYYGAYSQAWRGR
ncbi:MAG: hypothetical protein K8S15_07405 [Candidatus Aegiribacteria sp.]|nr:hypothetical protein [Candidatus Aegiribacteria sp.]